MPIYTHSSFSNLLKDPVVANAVLRNFLENDLSQVLIQEQILSQTFSADTIASLLSQTEINLIWDLVHTLPAYKFQGQKDLLLDLWNERSFKTKGYLAEVLAQIAPTEIAPLFAKELKLVFPLIENEPLAMSRILKGIGILPTDLALPILQSFYTQIESNPIALLGPCFYIFIDSAWKHGLYSIANDLIIFQINQDYLEDPSFDFIDFALLSEIIVGNKSWYFFFLESREGDTFSSRLNLPKELLMNESFLNSFDNLVLWNGDFELIETNFSENFENISEAIKTKWLPLLDPHVSSLMSRIIDSIRPDEEYEGTQDLVSFIFVLIAHHTIKTQVDISLPTKVLIEHYAAQDIFLPSYLDNVIKALNTKDHLEVVETLRNFLQENDDDLSEEKKVNLGYIIGRLNCFELIETLIGWISTERDYRFCEKIRNSIFALSDADKYIMAHWNSLNDAARNFLCSLIFWSEKDDLVKPFLLKYSKNMLFEDWSSVAMMHPDLDYLPTLQKKLNGYSGHVEEAFYIISVFLNESNELTQAIRGKLVNQRNHLNEKMQELLDFVNSDEPIESMSIPLQCHHCNAIDEYTVTRIMMTQDDHFRIPEAIKCKNCNVACELRVIPQAEVRIKAILILSVYENRENRLFFRESNRQASLPQTVRNTSKVGRNDLCPCGSGKKFKKCCLN